MVPIATLANVRVAGALASGPVGEADKERRYQRGVTWALAYLHVCTGPWHGDTVGSSVEDQDGVHD